MDKKLFGGSVSLRDVYIPLRCSENHTEFGSEEKVNRNVRDLTSVVKVWIDNGNRFDCFRILSGGPGFGKSSFARIFTEQINKDEAIRSVYIPLNRLNLSPEMNLRQEIQDYLIRDDIDFGDPLDPSGSDRILLFLDGLDELAMQGKDAVVAASAFISNATAAVSSCNLRARRVLCLIGSRESIVQDAQQTYDLVKTTWHLLPYHIDDFKQYHWPDDLKNEDQRNLWWQKFGRATGANYQNMPQNLISRELDPLTSLPLLNHLVAIAYENGNIDFSQSPMINKIYLDLIKTIHKRDWADRDPLSKVGIAGHNQANSISFDVFVRLLEEIAITAWHSGDTRTAKVSDINERCIDMGLAEEWELLKDNSSEALTRLFATFYIRWTRYGAGVVEFTHKSFGDYLVARRVINIWRDIYTELQAGYGQPDNLVPWLKCCGPVPLDSYILTYMRLEVSTSSAKPKEWQGALVSLIRTYLPRRLPVENLKNRRSLLQEEALAANAEAAFFALLSICAGFSGQVSKIRWPHQTSAKELIQRIQRSPSSQLLRLGNLSRCDFSICEDEKQTDLSILDLSEVNLEGAILSNVNLRGSILERTILIDAHIDNANLSRTDVTGTKLTEVTGFNSANLEDAIGIDSDSSS